MCCLLLCFQLYWQNSYRAVHLQVYKAVQDDVRTVAVKVSHVSAQPGLSASLEGGKASQRFWLEIEQLADCRDTHILQVYSL